MRISSLAALMILTTVLLSACGKEQMASLEDNGNHYYGRSGPITSGRTQIAGFTPTPGMISYEPQASLDSVASSDLPPPAALPAPAFAPMEKPAAVAMSGWQWPVQGKVIQAYGKPDHGIGSEGIRIAATPVTAIRAAAPGEVGYVGNQLKDYGQLVILRHPDGTMSSYAHAAEIIVAKGDHVRAGDVLGYVGMTGNAKEPQLHFAVREGGRTVDPMGKLPTQMASN